MKKLLIILSLFTVISAQSTSAWSGRVHPELKWKTISTKHFNVHYHQGIEDIAKEGALLAEHYRPTLLAQMDVDTIPRIDIIFTTEDEIMNGFATWMYNTFIWVDQNDASIWLEKEKWLQQVLAHELQHIVLLHKTKSWFPDPLARLFSGIPSWVVEGTAEYETESWRPYRADLSHKIHVLKNKMNSMDPHHDGFSKMLYWADRFGDSTITQTLAYRNNLKLFSFGAGFKKATGISVSQFNEDWRRHMNTYYYGYRSQKETYKEIGEVFTLPINKMQSFTFYPDSNQIAFLGLLDKGQFDTSLIIAKRDTAKERERFEDWEERIKKLKEKEKKTKKDSLALEKPYKEKVVWKKDEVDFGQFHKNMDWSKDGKKIAYSKYHYGKNQSMVYDIKIYDTETKAHRWLTKSIRGTYPVWMDSVTIAFVAYHKNVSNIYTLNIAGGEPKRLTNFTNNTQIVFPSLSHDGQSLAFAMNPENGNMDIYTLHLQTNSLKRITTDTMADIGPVWHPNGLSISYTSNTSGVPNIQTVDLKTGTIIANTDAGDGIWTEQWMPKDSLLIASSLGDADSVRLVKVDPFRMSDTKPLSLRDNYTSWQSAGPDVSFVNAEPDSIPNISEPTSYKFTNHLRPYITMVLPTPSPFAMFSWIDALGKNTFISLGYLVPDDVKKSGLFLYYSSASFGPLWSIAYSQNISGLYRRYQKAHFYDNQNGLSFALNKPINFGESLMADHRLSVSATFIKHNVTVGQKTDKMTGELIPVDTSFYDKLPMPDSGRNGFISIGYDWRNRRPHKSNAIAPKQGLGLEARIDYANKSLFGDFDYARFQTDMFVNLSLNKSGTQTLYTRLKTMAVSGKPPAQDYVGLTEDAPMYIEYGGANIFVRELYNPRGWSEYRLGEKMFFGSVELRQLMGPFSINLISDFGNAWSSGTEKEKMIITAGYELRFALGPLALSGGEAQLIDDWKADKKPLRYLRLMLANPF